METGRLEGRGCTVTVGKARKKTKWRIGLTHWQIYAMLIPGLASFIIFNYGTMWGNTIAFKNFAFNKTLGQMSWAGLKHFEKIFADPYFLMTLRNTIVLSIYRLIFGFPIPIIFALLLNELRSMRYKRIVQTVSYMPNYLSWVIMSSIFIGLLSLEGPINTILKMVGMQKPIYFLGDKKVFRAVLIVTDIWKSAGFSCVMYLAAISSIDVQLYESAKLDGSTRLQNIIYITIPCISNVIVIALILRMGSAVSANFEQIVNLYSPQVYDVADVIETFVYRRGLLDGAYNMAAAVDVFKSVVGLILVLTTNEIAKRIGGKEAAIW